MESTSLRPCGLLITPQRYGFPDLPGNPAYRLEPIQPVTGWSILLRPPIADNVKPVVQEY